MSKVVLTILATLASTIVAWADSPIINDGLLDAYQVRYFANLLVPNNVSFMNLTNTGVQGGSSPSGDICVNIYVMASDQQELACCTCLLTPNHIQTLSAADLTGNDLTPGAPSEVSVALIATNPVNGVCNAALVNNVPQIPPIIGTSGQLVGGLRAWATTTHAEPTSPVTYGITETEFSKSKLSQDEANKLVQFCGFIEADGSGHGICKNCPDPSRGGSAQGGRRQ